MAHCHKHDRLAASMTTIHHSAQLGYLLECPCQVRGLLLLLSPGSCVHTRRLYSSKLLPNFAVPMMPGLYGLWKQKQWTQTVTRFYQCARCTLKSRYWLCAVCSVDFFRETEPELQHPSSRGLSPAAIWLYRILNFPLNTLNAFWFYKMLTGALKVLRAPSHPVTSDAQATDRHKVQ